MRTFDLFWFWSILANQNALKIFQTYKIINEMVTADHNSKNLNFHWAKFPQELIDHFAYGNPP